MLGDPRIASGNMTRNLSIIA